MLNNQKKTKFPHIIYMCEFLFFFVVKSKKMCKMTLFILSFVI